MDEFCKKIEALLPSWSLSQDVSHKTRKRKFKLSDSEVITIMIMFHRSHYRELKNFYLNYICVHCRHLYPQIVSYNRFVELQEKALLPMICFLQLCCLSKCTGISFVDSTKIAVCHPKRGLSNQVFKGIATKSKSGMGWFTGFKFHLIINDRGEILSFMITGVMSMTESHWRWIALSRIFSENSMLIEGIFHKGRQIYFLWMVYNLFTNLEITLKGNYL